MAYKNVKYGKKAVRRNYSKIRTEVELPDLLEIQTSSFEKFVSEDLKELFKDISPISNESGTLNLYFTSNVLRGTQNPHSLFYVEHFYVKHLNYFCILILFVFFDTINW